jgi:hypothetical protein
MVCDGGDAEIEKLPPPPAALTARVTVVEWDRLPLVPVMVRV